ncbi:RHS repeat domain-containing protein [Paenibacillus thiaminolyticus]|uniref:RHS repeat domain-containing protein n=2 Tax=Paenibacillus thiaminolyticus TaxID=49283 RepID=UPI0035A6EA9E
MKPSRTHTIRKKTAYRYNLTGDLIAIQYPDGNRVLKSYDAIGRLVKQTDPMQQIQKFYYDANGNVVKRIDRKGQTHQFVYNTRELLTSSITADETISYTYDSDQVIPAYEGVFSDLYSATSLEVLQSCLQGQMDEVEIIEKVLIKHAGRSRSQSWIREKSIRGIKQVEGRVGKSTSNGGTERDGGVTLNISSPIEGIRLVSFLVRRSLALHEVYEQENYIPSVQRCEIQV